MIIRRVHTLGRHLNRKNCASNSIYSPATSWESNQSYIYNKGKNPLVYRNVGQELEKAARIYGSTEAIVSYHEGKRYTFTSLIDEVDRIAAGFLKLGLKKGDRVGLWGPNNIHWYLTMMGACRAGLVSVGINPAFQAPELEYCLKKVNVKAIVSPLTHKTHNYYEIIRSLCPEISSSQKGDIKSENLPHLKAVIIDTDEALKGALTFNELLDIGNKEDLKEIEKLQPYIIPDSPCNIQFTSGTTGQPKAAVLSHFNFVNNGIHIGNRNQTTGARICVQVPLFHAFGVVVTIMPALSHGGTLVLPAPAFNPEASLRSIVDEKCTVIHGTPTMYVDLIRKQKELNLPLSTLKMAVTGGAICTPQLFLDMQNILKVKEFRNVYGLTESTASIFLTRANDTVEQILTTVGHIQDDIEVKVIDKDGNTVPFGQPGELCVRGYLTMLGYYGDEQKTKETIGSDKWLRTGDQFVLQPDGYGRIVGRLKEMIIRGGENIFPKEIEDFLNTHENIMEAYVIGVPDERLGEELCAFLRLQDDTKEITRDTLKEFSKGKLAYFKVPRYVVTVKEFPKTTSGKIQKFKLLQQFKTMQESNAST
ncbi:medium-chain acyl-CoA ligase ACSF2, mitochondrial [Musca vetustissima]|uniref:medium-chain acyl-CoA ligase ACSF2, mitochondrial n=1 Tax=Musca vetustissima TaxID=27455 RepID=UPI002AB685B0|nr:medium-chain acyl-CoA ligase ACSF2, mitochondrial [Musca vetustissima]